MSEIDFALTTDGGRVRLSTITRVQRPKKDHHAQWVVPVTTDENVDHIGPFHGGELAASRWVDATFRVGDLP